MEKLKWDNEAGAFIEYTNKNIDEAELLVNAEPSGRVPVSDGKGRIKWRPLVLLSKEEPADPFMGMLWLEKG